MISMTVLQNVHQEKINNGVHRIFNIAQKILCWPSKREQRQSSEHAQSSTRLLNFPRHESRHWIGEWIFFICVARL